MTCEKMLSHSAARAVAEAVASAMTPHCLRCEIAGSIRRGKPEVKDIEIVAIPKWEPRPDPASLFGEEIQTNLLRNWALSPECPVRWIKPGTSEVLDWQPKADGRYWRGLIKGIKLDLFITEPLRWGVTQLIRTGSADFSHAIATHALQSGYKFHEGGLWRMVGGVPITQIETPDEASVFRALGLRWIEPQCRVGEMDLRRTV